MRVPARVGGRRRRSRRTRVTAGMAVRVAVAMAARAALRVAARVAGRRRGRARARVTVRMCIGVRRHVRLHRRGGLGACARLRLHGRLRVAVSVSVRIAVSVPIRARGGSREEKGHCCQSRSCSLHGLLLCVRDTRPSRVAPPFTSKERRARPHGYGCGKREVQRIGAVGISASCVSCACSCCSRRQAPLVRRPAAPARRGRT